MKPFAFLSATLATALAAPATPLLPSNLLTARTLFTCPANAVQPNGRLSHDAISTSALVPISVKQPNRAFGATDWAKVTPGDFCTVFNLELDPTKTQGKLCNLVFNFPSLLQAPGLSTFLGSGKFTFTGYAFGTGALPGVTTYNNQPAPGPSPPNPPPTMKPGNSYVVNSAPCGIPEGTPAPITVSRSLCSKDTLFLFKQSDHICPMGFYVVLTEDPNAGMGH